jgi:hypothetical protein
VTSRGLLSAAAAVLLAASAVGSAAEAPRADPEAPGEAGAEPSLFARVKSLFAGPDRRFVIVPIPQSDPTLGSGVTLVGIYFWPQSEQQKAQQPASSTAGFGMYTDSESFAFGVQQQGYWSEDRWRFEGLLGHADLKLDFFGIGADAGDRDLAVSWNLQGELFNPKLLRRLTGDWYLGGEVPFYDLCRLGIRGFSATQYMDETLLSGQAELRWHVIGPVGVTGFVGTGHGGRGAADRRAQGR